MQPLVSVLMTAYNREAFIASAIESVLASTFTDFELVIVDDRSTDNTVAIARKYAALDSRVNVFVNSVNLGDYPNRNQAAAYAKGTYLKYFDSDDLLYPHSLQIFVDAMEANPAAGFAFTDGSLQDDQQPYPVLYGPEAAYLQHYFGNRGLFFAGPGGTIIRKEVFQAVGGFSGKAMIGDMELWLKIAAAYPVLKIQPGLLWWRVHTGQQFSQGLQNDNYLLNRYLVNMQGLRLAPLSSSSQQKAAENLQILFYRRVVTKYILPLKFARARQLTGQANLRFGGLLKAGKKIHKLT